MNICFFSQEYPPETHVGGIGTYTYNMAGALASMGHTIHVVTSTEHSERTYQDNGVWVHRILNRQFMPIEFSQFKYSYYAAKKVSEIGCEFDIIQSSEFAAEALWYSFNKKYPLITRLATPFFQLRRLNGRFFLGLRPFSNWMEKYQTLHSNGVFTSTKVMAEVVAEEWGIETSSIKVIPNSVDLSRIMKLGNNEPVPGNLENLDYLVYFGRLEERKGVNILADILPEIFKRFSDLSMVFVGSDYPYRGSSMREYIRKESNQFLNRIIFYDNLPQGELFPIVNAAKMVILPSLWEAFGFVCVEAMALGRPVVAGSGSGFEEIIEDNVSGFLVEPGNKERLKEKIIDFLFEFYGT